MILIGGFLPYSLYYLMYSLYNNRQLLVKIPSNLEKKSHKCTTPLVEGGHIEGKIEQSSSHGGGVRKSYNDPWDQLHL